LLIGPSISPENAWKGRAGERLALCMSSTMDVQITRALFDHCIEAAALLGIDADFAATLSTLREKLPPTRVDGSGRIAEWLEDVEEYELGHRHNSHLFALYPDDQITPQSTPDLAAAARKSLETRIANGGAGTAGAVPGSSVCGRAWATVTRPAGTPTTSCDAAPRTICSACTLPRAAT
jgi:alpha-L-fucosidase 2